MNTLELLKVSRKKQNHICVNPGNTIQQLSSTKKPQQSRLSYLKKLFSKKNLTEPQNIKNDSFTQQEMKAFAKSRVTINSNKNFQKMHLRQIPIDSHLPSTHVKTVTRFTSIDENHITPHTKLLTETKSNHVKAKPIRYLENAIQRQTNDKFFQRHRKIASQSYENGNLNKSAVHSRYQLPRYQMSKQGNRSFVQPQKKSLKKRQIRQLKKIGRMLQDIKCEILKNRSVIIEGMKEIKHLQNVKAKRIQFESKERVDYFREIVEEYEELKDRETMYGKGLNSNNKQNERYSHDPRPRIEYRKIHRIR